MSFVPFDRLTSYALHAKRLIAEQGYIVQRVPGDGRSTPFSYTVGLHESHGYELVMVGIDNPTMDGVLHALVERFTDSAGPAPDLLLEGLLPHGYLLRMRPVQSPEPFSILRAVYGAAVCPPFWQAVWPDPESRFPGDAGYAMPHQQQLLP
ncbi:DUF4262 domain-containing protein [Streptomyces sp. NPDC048258]|uniref:DUF4262 domain-containing protein n=1 Tax=Streptomyces sp. NPDC048258 TaxID=3365527 RepID=UPI003710A658